MGDRNLERGFYGLLLLGALIVVGLVVFVVCAVAHWK